MALAPLSPLDPLDPELPDIGIALVPAGVLVPIWPQPAASDASASMAIRTRGVEEK